MTTARDPPASVISAGWGKVGGDCSPIKLRFQTLVLAAESGRRGNGDVCGGSSTNKSNVQLQ